MTLRRDGEPDPSTELERLIAEMDDLHACGECAHVAYGLERVLAALRVAVKMDEDHAEDWQYAETRAAILAALKGEE